MNRSTSPVQVNSVYKQKQYWIGGSRFSSKKIENFKEFNDSSSDELSSFSLIRYLVFTSETEFLYCFIPNNETFSPKLMSSLNTIKGTYVQHNGIIYLKYFMNISHIPKRVKDKAIIKGDTLHSISYIANRPQHLLYTFEKIRDNL